MDRPRFPQDQRSSRGTDYRTKDQFTTLTSSCNGFTTVAAPGERVSIFSYQGPSLVTDTQAKAGLTSSVSRVGTLLGSSPVMDRPRFPQDQTSATSLPRIALQRTWRPGRKPSVTPRTWYVSRHRPSPVERLAGLVSNVGPVLVDFASIARVVALLLISLFHCPPAHLEARKEAIRDSQNMVRIASPSFSMLSIKINLSTTEPQPLRCSQSQQELDRM
jgi:hypothetical protein